MWWTSNGELASSRLFGIQTITFLTWMPCRLLPARGIGMEYLALLPAMEGTIAAAAAAGPSEPYVQSHGLHLSALTSLDVSGIEGFCGRVRKGVLCREACSPTLNLRV